MSTDTPTARTPEEFDRRLETPVGGPVTSGWREGTLTRAKELESQCAVAMAENQGRPNSVVLAKALHFHVDAARDAANRAKLNPRRWFRPFRYGPLMERALSNLYAAEANLLSIAPVGHVLGQMPSLLRHVQRHLEPTDPRLREFERIAKRLQADPEAGTLAEEDRVRIVTITRGASSEALREQVRVRSFRNILASTAIGMTILAGALVIAGFVNPTLVPMCFTPEDDGRAVVVCPTEQSDSFDVSATAQAQASDDIDVQIEETAERYDILVVELVGLAAAGLAAAAAIRGIRGSSERYGVPVMLAALKLPTGALTAVLGVVLMRGEFVPGLSALDTSAQILAWALLFGYGQQLFTRLVDRQGQTVLESVRSADKPATPPTPS
jgi:hypothetical protein